MAFSDAVDALRTWLSEDEALPSEKHRLAEYYRGKMANLDRKKLVEERRALVAARFARAVAEMTESMETDADRHDLGEVLGKFTAFSEAGNLARITEPRLLKSERAGFPELSKLARIIRTALDEAEEDGVEISHEELYPEFLREAGSLRWLRPHHAPEAARKPLAGKLVKAVRSRWYRLMDNIAKFTGQ